MCDGRLADSPVGETLHRSAVGSLGYCHACGSFGLAFGSLYLRLGAAGVVELNRTLDGLASRPPGKDNRHLIHFRGTPATLALDPSELSSLGSILREGCHRARELGALESPSSHRLRADSWVN